MPTRTSVLRTSGLAVAFVVSLWPVLLLVVHLQSPLLAVEIAAFTGRLLWKGFLYGGLAFAVACLAYPPVPAALRLFFARLGAILRTDRGSLMRAEADLRHVDNAARRLEAGRLALQFGDDRRALPHLQRALELEPASVPTRYQLGLWCLRQRRLGDAHALLQQVETADPGHAFGEALLLIGRAAMLAGDSAAALRAFREHQRRHGGSRRSHFWLAQAALAQGDLETARAARDYAAAPPGQRQRLTAEENWYRARARVLRIRPPAQEARTP
jgi:tetratricopeptide (TPR) repeat protein